MRPNRFEKAANTRACTNNNPFPLDFTQRLCYAEMMENKNQDPFLDAIEKLVSKAPIQTILEIGASTGEGTTRALINGIQKNPNQPTLYSIEADADKFAILKNKWKYPFFVPCHVSTISSEQLPTPKDVEKFMDGFRQNSPPQVWQRNCEKFLEWLEEDKQFLQANPNLKTNGIEWIKNNYKIDTFDLLLIDGSEFTGKIELQKTYGAKYIILDDIKTYKNFINFHHLKIDPFYNCKKADFNFRNGFAIFEKNANLKNGISAIVHTRNEENNIAECLESLNWVNELIVIDMESRDRTVELAQKYNAQVFSHPLVKCVDEARNFGLQKATFAWSLVVDADERIPPQLAVELKKRATLNQYINGFWLPRKNIFFERWVEYEFPDYQMRLFKTGAANWSGRVHQFAQVQGETNYLPADSDKAIIHYSYQSVSQFMERQMNYANISVREIIADAPPLNEKNIRAGFEFKMEGLLDLFKTNHLSLHEWTVRQLYLFSELYTYARLFEEKSWLQKKAPTISGYQFLRNAIKFDYPFRESIVAALSFCDEFILVYAESEDETEAEVKKLAAQHQKIKLFKTDWDQGKKVKGERLRLLADEAMSHCTKDWVIQVQADEVYHEADVPRIRSLVNQYQYSDVNAFIFQVLHFYHSYGQLIAKEAKNIGWYQKCIRMSRRGTFHHIDDAWSMKGKGQTQDADIRIFHYGHVREIEAMRLKASYMETLYHELADDYEICPSGEFKYDRVPQDMLRPFMLTEHPRIMRDRIDAFDIHHPNIPEHPQKYKLLIISRYHTLKKGFSITLSEIYKTGILHQHFDIFQLAWHYSGKDHTLDGVNILAIRENDEFGVNRLEELLLTIEPDIVLLHADAFFFLPYVPILKNWTGRKIGWFPLDFERHTNPSTWKPLLQCCDKLIAMSYISKSQYRLTYEKEIDIVGLGYNPQNFYPVPTEKKQRFRKELGWPEEAFIFLVVANNFWRKGVDYAVEAFRLFHKKYPQVAKNSYLYMHTDMLYALEELIQVTEIESHIDTTRNYDPMKNPLPDKNLRMLYQAADCLLMTSLAEGFGMPLLEAQACGIPIIASNNSVIPEVVGQAGLLIDCPVKISGTNTDCVAWVRPPDVNHAVELMYQLYCDSQLQQRLSKNALSQAQNKTWEHVSRKLLTSLLHEIGRSSQTFIFPEPELIAV